MPALARTRTDTAPRARPFLKWAGGKGQLLEQLRPLLPPAFERGRYFEPFVGGAALFFGLMPESATLSDVNQELIDCYRTVRDQVDELIEALRAHTHDEAHYYEVRGQDPRELPLPQRAARTIFLNRTGYNGLYRVNNSGRFNVPFGRYTKPSICNPEQLHACSAALRGVQIEVRDFEAVLELAKPGDFAYMDPPYSPVSATSSFTSYIPGGFGFEEQRRLAALFADLDRRGVRVMLSNSDVPEIHRLYRGFQIDRVDAARSINSRADSRGKIVEVVIRNYRPRRRRTKV